MILNAVPEKMTPAERLEIVCMQCPGMTMHKMILHGPDGCQVPGCGCKMSYSPPKPDILEDFL